VRLSKVVLAMFLAIAGVMCQAQDYTSDFERTATTGFPLAPQSGWYSFGSTDTDTIYFLSNKNINIRGKVNPVWVRAYRYKTNRLMQSLWTVDRLNNSLRITNATEYNLKTGATISTKYVDGVSFDPIAPDTIAESLLEFVNQMEEINIEVEKSLRMKGKKKK
jgi:hypothetical protein